MEMTMNVTRDELLSHLTHQLFLYFGITEKETELLNAQIDNALKKCKENFSHSKNKYFTKIIEGKETITFDTLHSVQHMIFLYYLSHNLYLEDSSSRICDKVYYLNKIMHSVDLFYAIELPPHFGAEHPLGAVMGRAIYGDGLFFYQGCTVGGTTDAKGHLHYPILGENVHMFSNSSILGKCTIGNNVNIGAGCIVKNENIPDYCNVFGESPNLVIKERRNG